MLLRRTYVTEMIRQVESFPSDIFHAPFHMSFLPSGPYITETILKTIETGHLHQGFCRLLVTTDKVLDGYTHIVIDHHGRDTMYIPEEVAVGFHEGKRILMPEKIGVSAIAMPESEYGQIKLDLDTVNKKKDFAPVKFNNASRLIKQQNKGFALFSLCVILYFLCN